MAWIATKRFTYGGHELFPGEFFEPQGLRNDRIIFGGDSRYVQAAAKAHDDWSCDRCGRRFAAEGQLRGHQRSLYTEEQVSPERLREIRRQAEKRDRKSLTNETVADVARRATGREVETKGGIPTIIT